MMRRTFTVRDRSGVHSQKWFSVGAAIKEGARLRAAGKRVTIIAHDDHGQHVWREWRRGAWREPTKRLKPLKKAVQS